MDITLHTSDPTYKPGLANRRDESDPKGYRRVHLDDYQDESWAQAELNDPEIYAHRVAGEWRGSDMRHSEEQAKKACARVRRLSRRLKPYVAERHLVQLIESETVLEDWDQRPLRQQVYITLRAGFEAFIPASFFHRRGPEGDLTRLMPLQAVIVAKMIEQYVDMGLGFEARPSLGPHIVSLRREYWEDWSKCVEEFGEDVDSAAYGRAEEVKTLSLLLRLGLDAVPLMSMKDAITFLAHELFAHGLHKLAAPVAVEEIIQWAQANANLHTGQVDAYKNLCKAIWNTRVPLAPATVSIVALVMRVFPRPAPGQRPKRLQLLRVSALRLIRRLLAQVQSWDDDVVDLPSTWFKPEKIFDDERSYPGTSTTTYYHDLLLPLIDAGVLTLESKGEVWKSRCARYRLHLENDGPELPAGDAEAQLAR
jgi:hypothetical protein